MCRSQARHHLSTYLSTPDFLLIMIPTIKATRRANKAAVINAIVAYPSVVHQKASQDIPAHQHGPTTTVRLPWVVLQPSDTDTWNVYVVPACGIRSPLSMRISM